MRAAFLLTVLQTCSLCWANDPSGPALNCSPQTIHPGEKLNIDGLPDNHKGWALTIAGSHDHLTYLVSSVNHKSNKFPVPIPADSFGKLKKLTLDVSTAKGISFDTGKVQGPRKIIFEKSDEYEISLSAPLGAADTLPTPARSNFQPIQNRKTIPVELGSYERLRIDSLQALS